MKKIIYSLLALGPVMAFAQTTQNFSNINGLFTEIKIIIGYVIPIIFGLALVYFFYGILKFIMAAGDPKAKEQGRNAMIYGIIALAVMASVWGLVNWLQGTFGVQNNTPITVPTVQGIPIQN